MTVSGTTLCSLIDNTINYSQVMGIKLAAKTEIFQHDQVAIPQDFRQMNQNNGYLQEGLLITYTNHCSSLFGGY